MAVAHVLDALAAQLEQLSGLRLGRDLDRRLAAKRRHLELSAERGSTTYGILSNQYLDVESNTPKYTCTVTVGDGEWSYDECTVYDVKSKNMTVQHTDKNTLKRVD